MAIKLFDLALADIEVRLSPYCWLVKFALLHKGLEFETVPLRFTEKENYPDPEHGALPILQDEEKIVCDSAHIIAHLEDKYSEKKLVATPGEQAAVDFYIAWLGAAVYPGLAALLIPRIPPFLHDDDKEYFRKSREERLGKTLEEFAATPGSKQSVEAALQILAQPLARHNFLGGETPNLADYLVFSPLMWQRSITQEKLYETPQAVDAWRERMLDLFDGYARKAKSAA